MNGIADVIYLRWPISHGCSFHTAMTSLIRSRIDYSITNDDVRMLVWRFNLTRISNLTGRFEYDFTRVTDNSMAAYFFGPPCKRSSSSSPAFPDESLGRSVVKSHQREINWRVYSGFSGGDLYGTRLESSPKKQWRRYYLQRRQCQRAALFSVSYMVAQQNWHTFLYALTSYALPSSNIDRFLNLFHCLNQEKIGNNTVTNVPATPHVYRYTTFWNISVLKAATENKTTSLTTYFK